MTPTISQIMAAAHRRAAAWASLNGKPYRQALALSLKGAWRAARAWKATPAGPKPSALYCEYFTNPAPAIGVESTTIKVEDGPIDFAMFGE